MAYTKILVVHNRLDKSVDYAQNGLGNRSCGPEVLPAYRLQPREARFVYTVQGTTGGKRNFRVKYSEALVPPLQAAQKNAVTETAEAYRDPSDADVRESAGFSDK